MFVRSSRRLREGFIGDAAVFHRVVKVSGGNEFRPVRALRDKSSYPFHVGVVGGTRNFSGLAFMGLPGEGGGTFREPVRVVPDDALHEEGRGFAGGHGSVEPAEDGEAHQHNRSLFNGGVFLMLRVCFTQSMNCSGVVMFQ